MGLVLLLMFLYDASINTFLYLALDFLKLFRRSGVRTTSHSRFLKLRFQFLVHLDPFFAGEGRGQGPEHLLIGWKQFLQPRVKVQTLDFLLEILLSMQVALSTFILLLPIRSLGR